MLWSVLITFIFLFVLYSWVNVLKDAKNNNIPGPFPLPLVGSGHKFLGPSSEFLKNLNQLCLDYGNAVRVYLLSSRYVIFFHPKLIEPIMTSTELITKGKSYNFLHSWLGQGLLTATGDRWKTHRKFLTPAFHFNILQNFLPVFCKNQKILIQNLLKTANGSPVNLFPIIALHALDNVTESIMGVSVNAQNDSESEYVKAINNLSLVIATRMRNPFIEDDAIFSLVPSKKVQDKALKIVHRQTYKVIDARRKELEKENITALNYNADIGIKSKQAFLDLLLLSDVNGRKIDDVSVREEVDTFMFEGHDTTTSGIVFCLYCISKYNDIQEKIFEEQKTIFGDDFERDPTYSELQQMKYLELVIKESLRLYPSVPLIQRMVTRDTDINGLKLLKNTSVIIDIFHMQRHPDVYEDPLDFRPERFESKSLSNKNAFSWLPFSAGPRNCIGQKFAMMEMKVTLSAIVKHLQILPCASEPLLCADLVLRSENGVHVKFIPRNSK